MEDILATLDGIAQAELIRKGEISPPELVDAAISRIQKLNPVLNAVITPLFDEARAAAASPTLPPGPFCGVPILLKDFGAMQVGQPYYMGNRALCDARSEAISWKSKDCFVASAPAQKQNAWTHVLPLGFQLSLE